MMFSFNKSMSNMSLFPAYYRSPTFTIVLFQKSLNDIKLTQTTYKVFSGLYFSALGCLVAVNTSICCLTPVTFVGGSKEDSM